VFQFCCARPVAERVRGQQSEGEWRGSALRFGVRVAVAAEESAHRSSGDRLEKCAMRRVHVTVAAVGVYVAWLCCERAQQTQSGVRVGVLGGERVEFPLRERNCQPRAGAAESR
jgi:hypothetical protein